MISNINLLDSELKVVSFADNQSVSTRCFAMHWDYKNRHLSVHWINVLSQKIRIGYSMGRLNNKKGVVAFGQSVLFMHILFGPDNDFQKCLEACDRWVSTTEQPV